MQIHDPVYGSCTLDEPILLELLDSPPVRRIRGVHQAGATIYINPAARGFTRYDHCVGTMLLLRRFGAALPEQIAGLLHDVPHTAFSHVVDYVIGDVYGQTYHERFFEMIVCRSEIGEILTRYGLDPGMYADESRFPLLDRPAPDLCADRIDYSLRHQCYDPIVVHDIPATLAALAVYQGQFVFTDPAVAITYTHKFLDWYAAGPASPREIGAYHLLAAALRRALTLGLISEADLWREDDPLYAILAAANDPEIRRILELLQPDFSCVVDPAMPDFISGVKNRYVDPLVVFPQGAGVRASALDPALAARLAAQRERLAAPIPLRVLPPVARSA
ncbi:MAG TPA: HD domain-containing protein [Chloroflexia bacterium]|nr:HD domain-containing protein [Chloroflexia bacterium]